MKQKINIRLVLVAILSATMTMLGIVFISYSLFGEQVRKDLKATAEILAATGIDKIADGEHVYTEDNLRITWIDADGNVRYDNDVAIGEMENHMNRPEVKAAFEQGSGASIRKSDTLNMKTFYQAILLDDGTVLRVATNARSLTSVFMQAIPIMLIIILLIIVICVLVSHLLTKQLLLPIKELAENIDQVPTDSVYRELSPFVNRIREQHEDILAAARSRQDFTANVSHELKTPLTAISGYAELIENRMVDEQKQIKFAGDIRKNADRLVSLINDIIRLSELDHSETKGGFTTQDLYEVAEERVELLQEVAAKKGVHLSLQGERAMVLSNRGMLVELFDNLIENAIRYNVKDGSVVVEIKMDAGSAKLIISDTGIGIPEADRERIFERFYRVDKSRSRETGGTGLGLAIVKHIVELHDGEIRLQSELGKGTMIQVIF
ncbi:MAG: ATP-binding protein [bacterium]|nr:ATP-binding protein [bacterium]